MGDHLLGQAPPKEWISAPSTMSRLRSWPDCYGYTYLQDTRTYFHADGIKDGTKLRTESGPMSWMRNMGKHTEYSRQIGVIDFHLIVYQSWTCKSATEGPLDEGKMDNDMDDGRRGMDDGGTLHGWTEYAYRDGQVVRTFPRTRR